MKKMECWRKKKWSIGVVKKVGESLSEVDGKELKEGDEIAYDSELMTCVGCIFNRNGFRHPHFIGTKGKVPQSTIGYEVLVFPKNIDNLKGYTQIKFMRD